MNKRRRFKAKRSLGANISKRCAEWPQRFVPCVIVKASVWRHHLALGQALDESYRAEPLRPGVD
jgi:hypothetical protein